MFQELIWTSHKTFAETPEHTQKEKVILSVTRVDGCGITETQLSLNNEIRELNRQKLYAEHYSRKPLDANDNLLEALRCVLKFEGPGGLKTLERHGYIE